MFKGKKKKEEELQEQETPVVINPMEATSELPPQQFQQPVQQIPQGQVQPVQQQVQQPVYQEQVQQVPQPVQQAPQRIACIVQAAIVEPGAYRYVIDTNYPLGIGNCDIAQ